MDHPVTIESFTVREAAEALGRSMSTLRRWIEDDKLPGPILEDTQYHYPLYSVGELEVIAREISRHEQEFVNLVTRHAHIVEQLQQAIFAYRAIAI